VGNGNRHDRANPDSYLHGDFPAKDAGTLMVDRARGVAPARRVC
jgi:hypothetical protein